MDYGGGYSTTSYGAQGAADGGGFMPGSQPSGSQGHSKDYLKNIRPVTIRQLNLATQSHPEADFRIDNVEVTQLTFIGQIRNISTQTTNVTYKLDDGTGTVEVKQWIDMAAENPDGGDEHGNRGLTANNKHQLLENEYCRVWGRLKVFGSNGRRHVGAHVIRPVTDKMEITFHLLEATYVHLYMTRGAVEQAAGNGHSKADDPMNGYGVKRELGGGDEGDTMMMGGRQLPAVSMNARKVYQCLKSSPQNNEGLHVQNIAANLALPVAEVMKAGDELLTHSMIFTTVDDNTWALLEF
ncbi:MAG: hypothetical protein LQ351_002554 [Letrouitia transgressa]|nr:MAG: hypothetical protein LQ351_002554 [Letrouitia transgressa]